MSSAPAVPDPAIHARFPLIGAVISVRGAAATQPHVIACTPSTEELNRRARVVHGQR